MTGLTVLYRVPFWGRLQRLIEETYEMNGNTPVAVVALSMGGPYFVGFLNNQVNQTWKDQYIHSFTSMSGVYGGSSLALATLVGASDGDIPSYINEQSYNNLARSIGSVVSLLPNPQYFPNQTFLTTPTMVSKIDILCL